RVCQSGHISRRQWSGSQRAGESSPRLRPLQWLAPVRWLPPERFPADVLHAALLPAYPTTYDPPTGTATLSIVPSKGVPTGGRTILGQTPFCSLPRLLALPTGCATRYKGGGGDKSRRIATLK